MTQDNEEPSAGSATHQLTLADIEWMYEQWKRLYCGPRRLVALVRKPYWKKVLSVPWLWWSHFGVARQRTSVIRSARLATLFVWAFLTCSGGTTRYTAQEGGR